jgi:hypothetical protein
MFSIDSEDFINDSFHLVLTLRSRFACFFCMFLAFRDLPDVKGTQTFYHVTFWEI